MARRKQKAAENGCGGPAKPSHPELVADPPLLKVGIKNGKKRTEVLAE
jgi:hypothetical protein